MSFCVVQDIPDGNQVMYDDTCEKLGITEQNPQWPDGMITHIAGPSNSGGWCIVSEWESKEQFEIFRDERLLPLVEGTGRSIAPPIAFEVYREYHAESLVGQRFKAA